MAIPELSLLWIGTFATVLSLALFIEFGDKWTRILITFTAAIVWGFFGISSYNVITAEVGDSVRTEPVYPLVYLGLGLASAVFLYGMYDLISGLGEEATETSAEDVFGHR